jgi:hypothetical protein
MRNLTPLELQSLQFLRKSPAINQVSIDWLEHNLICVTVISKSGATFEDVDRAISEVFPGTEVRGTPGYDKNGEYWSLDFEGETLVNVLMKKAPALTGTEG